MPADLAVACRVHACRESCQDNAVAELGALQQSCCSCMLASCHACICSQVLFSTVYQLQLDLAEVLTFSLESVNLNAQCAGLLGRGVCLFLLHLCAVWHGGGQKVSLAPI